jgi:tetratricopeptide (TPR) repeat protein
VRLETLVNHGSRDASASGCRDESPGGGALARLKGAAAFLGTLALGTAAAAWWLCADDGAIGSWEWGPTAAVVVSTAQPGADGAPAVVVHQFQEVPAPQPLSPAARRVEAERACAAGIESFTAGRLVEAARQFSEAVELDPEFADGHYRLGLVCLRAGDVRRAREQQEALARLDPSLAGLLANLVP